MELIAKTRHVLAIAAAALGTVFCALAAFDLTESVCRTQGCALFKGAAIYGVSLYWFGVAGFLVLGAALLAKGRSWSRPAVLILLSLALLADAGLLGVQALTAACMNCLAVATLLGFMGLMVFPLRSKLSLLLVFWAFFYVAGLMSAAGELLGPVPFYGQADARTRIFFSPTCPACAKLVKQTVAAGGLNADTALFTVAKNDEDARRIARLNAAVLSGQDVATALETCFDQAADLDALPPSWKIRIDSFRNKSFLARSGAKSIPYVFSDAFMFTGEEKAAVTPDAASRTGSGDAAPAASVSAPEPAESAGSAGPAGLGAPESALKAGETAQPVAPASETSPAPVSASPAPQAKDAQPSGTGFLPGLIHPSNTCGYAEDTDCSK